MKKQDVWETDVYYVHARAASLDIKHPSMKLLKKISNKKLILDLGCGDGTRLNYLTKGRGTGVDISQKAISLAKRKSKNKFINGDLEKLPFDDNSFDLVYSAFVLEHTNNTEKVINEAIRVLKKNGELVFVCPNYGSPNRTSPPNINNNRVCKLINGYILDILYIFVSVHNLKWQKVNPLKGRYFSDSDTTTEPYALTLKKYLQVNKMKVKLADTLWSEELEDASILQKIFRIFGEKGLYPVKYWGPHLLIYAKK